MTCAPPPRSSASWPWRRCGRGCPRAAASAGSSPPGKRWEAQAAPASKPAVSRRFVAATGTALTDLMSCRLDDPDLAVFMADGGHFGEHTCVVAPGIAIGGVRHPLARKEGSTENATLVTGLITGLRERGLDVTRPILAVLDGAKAPARAVKDVFDRPLTHRCQQHKIRINRLPGKLRTVVEKRMREAYHASSAVEAEGLLTAVARELDRTHPGAAASLREGMAGTPTIVRLGVPPTLARTPHAGGTRPWRAAVSLSRCAGRSPGRRICLPAVGRPARDVPH